MAENSKIKSDRRQKAYRRKYARVDTANSIFDKLMGRAFQSTCDKEPWRKLKTGVPTDLMIREFPV